MSVRLTVYGYFAKVSTDISNKGIRNLQKMSYSSFPYNSVCEYFRKSNCVYSSVRSIGKTDGLRLLHGILHAKPLVQPTRSPRGEFIGKPRVSRNSRNGVVPITGEDCSQICMKLRNRDL